MAFGLMNSSCALILVVGLSFFMSAVPILASSMEGAKTELRDGASANNGGGSAFNSANGAGNFFANRRNLRSIYGLGPKMLQISRSKIPIELDLLVENEDGDRSKRFDDYGHMRFGKRGGEEQFDDYGHMRFGRSA